MDNYSAKKFFDVVPRALVMKRKNVYFEFTKSMTMETRSEKVLEKLHVLVHNNIKAMGRQSEKESEMEIEISRHFLLVLSYC